jgi:hypothetical protein
MSLIIKGTVTQAPEARVSPNGDAVLTLVVDGVAGWPFEARIAFGQDPGAIIDAQRYARRVRKGDHVTIEATGALPRQDHGLAVNALRGITRVDVRSDAECFVVPGLLR